MSVISKFEAVPNRIEQFWLYLVNSKKTSFSESELISTFSPQTLFKNNDEAKTSSNKYSMFKNVFKQSLLLGIINQDQTKGEGEKNISQTLPPIEVKSDEAKKRWLAEKLFKILTHPQLAKDADQAEVPLALAWLTLQSPTTPLYFGTAQNVIVSENFPYSENRFGLTGGAHFEQCYYWGRYLGLCTFSAHSNKRIIVPDPTVALLRIFPHIFSESQEMSATEFLYNLGKICPVLERGEARKLILSQAAHPNSYPQDDEFSEGTSLALLRLESENIISLEDRSDAKSPCVLKLGDTTRRISNISFLGESYGTA